MSRPATPATLLADLEARAAELVRVASEAPLGGGPPWQAVLTAHGVAPLPADDRQAYLASGMPMNRGALPIEVRRVLEVLQRTASAALAHLAASQEVDDAVERRVATLADRAMRDYLHAVRPPVTAGGIFANARASTPRFAATVAGVATMRCSACGASRSSEGDQACRFCGAPIYRDGEADER